VQAVLGDDSVVTIDGPASGDAEIQLVVFAVLKGNIEAPHPLENTTAIEHCRVHADIVAPQELAIMVLYCASAGLEVEESTVGVNHPIVP